MKAKNGIQNYALKFLVYLNGGVMEKIYFGVQLVATDTNIPLIVKHGWDLFRRKPKIDTQQQQEQYN
jgi:hypothetical protein